MHRADLTALAPISEAHFADLYGAAMRRFHDKYKNAGPDLFVNFNPVQEDPRDKTILGQQMQKRHEIESRHQSGTVNAKDAANPIYKTPDHNDPVGTYTYPASYVANHWFDIEYGKDMGFLRVLKAKVSEEKTLRLDNMSREKFLEAMKRLNLEFHVHNEGYFTTKNPKDAMMIYEAIFEHEAPSSPHFRVNSYGKTIFKLIQIGYTFDVNKQDDEDEEDPEDDLGYSSAGDFKFEGYLAVATAREHSQQKQTLIARKAGYDLILDLAKSPLEATVYPAEPEQAIFLTKRSYDVVETFKLTAPEGSGDVTAIGEPKGLYVKIAGSIAKAIGDKVVEPITSKVEALSMKGEWNLHTLRNWIATEDATKQPAVYADPTIKGEGYGSQLSWITGQGRLIVITAKKNLVSSVADPEATARTHAPIENARIRPGEDQASIADNLKSYAQESLVKPEHRKFGAHNPVSFKVGIVGPAANPVCFFGQPDEKIEDIVHIAKTSLEKASATKLPWRRITPQLLEQFGKALSKRGEVKPPAGPAAPSDASGQPSATLEEPGGSPALTEP